jgi:hypothetical protein
MKHHIRPGLEITTYTVPGSSIIRWTYPGLPHCTFAPASRSWHPYADSDVASVLSNISKEDLALIEARLLKYDEERRNSVRQHNTRHAMSENLNEAFSQAVFEFIPDGKPTDFWVITAWNPNGDNLEASANQELDRSLHQRLVSLGRRPFRVIGMNRDRTHVEPGWGFPTTEAEAIALGKVFQQLAVFHFTPDGIDLVDCQSASRQPLTSPWERIRDPRQHLEFVLHLGSIHSKELGSQEIAEVQEVVGTFFEGFTLIRGVGHFRKQCEDSVLIHIATRNPTKVIELAQVLRVKFHQIGIGISHRGIYQSIREWTDVDLLLETFGLAPVNRQSS